MLAAERAYVATMMKLTMVMAMLASSLQLAAQTKYQVVTLPDLGASGQANSIINRGWVAGGVNLPGGVYSEATAWINGSLVRLGTLGGPNSLVAWPVANSSTVSDVEVSESTVVQLKLASTPFFSSACSAPAGILASVAT